MDRDQIYLITHGGYQHTRTVHLVFLVLVNAGVGVCVGGQWKGRKYQTSLNCRVLSDHVTK